MGNPPSSSTSPSASASQKKDVKVYVISDSSDEDEDPTLADNNDIDDNAKEQDHVEDVDASTNHEQAATPEQQEPQQTSRSPSPQGDAADDTQQALRSPSPNTNNDNDQPNDNELFFDISEDLPDISGNQTQGTDLNDAQKETLRDANEEIDAETAKDADSDVQIVEEEADEVQTVNDGSALEMDESQSTPTPKPDDDAPPDDDGSKNNIDPAVKSGGTYVNEADSSQEEVEEIMEHAPKVAENPGCEQGASSPEQHVEEIQDEAGEQEMLEQELEDSAALPLPDTGGVDLLEAYVSQPGQNIDEDGAFASAQQSIEEEKQQETESTPPKGRKDIEMIEVSTSSPQRIQNVPDVVIVNDDSDAPRACRPTPKNENKKHPAYEARMDIDRRFGSQYKGVEKKKKQSVSSSSSSGHSSSGTSSSYVPEGSRDGDRDGGRDRDGNRDRSERRKRKSTSSSEPQAKPKKYVSVNLGDGVVRKALILEYLPQVKMHFVRFMDEKGGSERVQLMPHNHRRLSADEIQVLEDTLGANTMDDINDLTRPPRTRIQPKRRPRPRNLLPQPARPEKKSKQFYVTKRVPLPPAQPEKGPGYELVGGVITIRWPINGGQYVALVVGFRKVGMNERKHKLFYVCDESTEEVDLRKRDWQENGPGCAEWDRAGLVSKRIVVMWQAEYENMDIEDEECNHENDENVPFEAFVVRYLDKFTYRILYTMGDQLEDRDMNTQKESWELCEPGIWEYDNLPIVSWSTREENRIAPYRADQH